MSDYIFLFDMDLTKTWKEVLLEISRKINTQKDNENAIEWYRAEQEDFKGE